ncbi:MAG TPA: PAS domain S-box protein [Chloroflexia bacterium]|nr:PAS domain S-box protein [Chloroflexia bacterium]
MDNTRSSQSLPIPDALPWPAADGVDTGDDAQYRLLFEANPQAMWVFDAETLRFLAVNDVAVEHYGWRRAEFLSMTLLDIRLPEDVPALLHSLAELGDAPAWAGAFRHRTSDGSLIWVDIATRGITFAGRPARIATGTDITERRRTEEALRHSEEKYRDLIENANDIIYTQDFDGNFTSANAVAARTFGYTVEEILRKNIRDLIHPDDAGLARARLAEKRAGYQHETPVELRAYTKDGRALWIEVSSRIIRSDGRPSGIEGIARDITDRKEAAEALRRSEERFAVTFHASPAAIGITRLSDGMILDVNRSCMEMLGYTRDELIGESTSMVGLWPEGGDRARLLRALREQGSVHEWPMHFRTKSGELRAATMSVERIDLGGEACLLLFARDITEQRQVEAQLRLQATALESAANAITITDRAGRMTWINPAFARLTGYSQEEALGRPISLVRSGEQDRGFYATMWQTVLGGQVWHGELVNRRKDGSLYTVEQTITPVPNGAGEITHFTSIMQDITERKHSEAQIAYLASHDPLTGLPNRHALEQDLERAVARARRGQHSVLLLLDMDNFKLVNDTLGHSAGDQLLVTLTGLLAEHLRDGDLLTRWGGDDFAVLLEATSLAQAFSIAEALRGAVDSFQFQLGDRSFELSLSIGLVPVTGQQATQVLLAQADTAMYAAKEQGGNRVMLYHPAEESLVQLSAANQWIRRIKDALREGRLLLCFQPVANLNTRRVEHYEALIRMRTETDELILPGAFISAAERFGLMPPIDHWVVHEVVETLRTHPHIRLFMNLSGRSLLDEGLLDFIANELRAAGVAPQRLGFEITETAVIRDPDSAIQHLQTFADIGVQLAIDDYGAGLSSLAYLKRLPANELKIDKMFIMQLTSSNRDPLIVRSTIDLAHALEMEVTAEGVETPSALALLSVMGCDMVQGFLLSRPLGFDAFRKYLFDEAHLASSANVQSFIRPESFWKRA